MGGQRQLLSALLFEAFPYFQRFSIFANAANSCKTLLKDNYLRAFHIILILCLKINNLGFYIPTPLSAYFC